MSKPGSIALHKAKHDPRAAAIVALNQILHEHKDSQALVDALLSASNMVPTDKRLFTTLVYGSLRSYIRLEWFLLRFLKKPEKLPEEMLLSLIVALYEMTALRIPARASVAWSVNHIGNRFGQGLGKVANGTLRAMQRSLKSYFDEATYAEDGASPLTALSRRMAMPEWIVELWQKAYGLESALLYLESAQEPAPSGLRLNRAVPEWQNLRDTLAPKPAAEDEEPDGADKLLSSKKTGREAEHPYIVAEAALAWEGTLPWEARDMVVKGQASRQSAASYEALQSLSPQTWQGSIWDACAGRGGKTLSLLEQGLHVGLATDPSADRLNGLQEELARLHLNAPGLRLQACSAVDAATELGKTGELFDVVLVDAPCSGLGTLSRRPEIRLRRTQEDIDGLVRLQAEILAAVKPCIRPGGLLAYITCTLSPAENEDQVAAFMKTNQNALAVHTWHTPADSPLREFFFASLIQIG